MSTFCTVSFDVSDDNAPQLEKRLKAYLSEVGAKNVLFTKDSGDDEGSSKRKAKDEEDDDVLAAPRRR